MSHCASEAIPLALRSRAVFRAGCRAIAESASRNFRAKPPPLRPLPAFRRCKQVVGRDRGQSEIDVRLVADDGDLGVVELADREHAGPGDPGGQSVAVQVQDENFVAGSINIKGPYLSRR